MGQPTVDDAIRLLTDPRNRTMGPPDRERGMVQMRPPATIGELQGMGADEERARELVREAVEVLGGEMYTTWRQRSGLRPGRFMADERREDNIWIPLEALRDLG